MKSPGHLVAAVIWLGAGVVLLFAWPQMYEGALNSHRRLAEFLRLPVGSERFYRAFGRAVVIVVSVACLLAAVADVEQAFTGRESRMRAMQWGDLWPFGAAAR